MARIFKDHRFFLFETDLNNNANILKLIINPLFILNNNCVINIETIRDMDYSFDYVKTKEIIKKRFILVAANTNLNMITHLKNMDTVVKTNTINNNVYQIIEDITYTINPDSTIYHNQYFNFRLSYINFEGSNKYMVAIPSFNFFSNKYITDKLLINY